MVRFHPWPSVYLMENKDENESVGWGGGRILIMTKPTQVSLNFDDTYHPGAFEIKLSAPVGQYSDIEVTLIVHMDRKTVDSQWRTGEL